MKADSRNMGNKRFLNLEELPPGKKAKLIRIEGGYGVRQRLYEMGLTPGTEIVVVSNTGRGPLLVSTRGVTLALGRGIARKIVVEVI